MTNYADHTDSMIGMVQEMTAANNAWSAEQAQIQRDWQEKMSNTAHQREVADLLAAGLNPAASASTSGASTPTGAKGDTDTSGVNALLSFFTQTTQSLINAQTQMAVADKTTAMNELIARLQLQNARQLQDDMQDYNSTHPSNTVEAINSLLGSGTGSKDNSAFNLVSGFHSGLSDVFESGYNSWNNFWDSAIANSAQRINQKASNTKTTSNKKKWSYADSKLKQFLDSWAGTQGKTY